MALLVLALASFLIGLLDQTAWFLAYAGLLFICSGIIGFWRPNHFWLWILLLALGSPAACLLLREWGGKEAGETLIEDFVGRLAGAFIAILPGLGVGWAAGSLYSRLRRAISRQPEIRHQESETRSHVSTTV